MSADEGPGIGRELWEMLLRGLSGDEDEGAAGYLRLLELGASSGWAAPRRGRAGPATTKAICHVCGQEVVLTPNGVVGAHADPGGAPDDPICRGVGQPPGGPQLPRLADLIANLELYIERRAATLAAELVKRSDSDE